MSFVVDSDDWRFDGWSAAELQSALEDLLERIDVTSRRNERVWIGEDLQTQSVFEQLDLWSLRGPGSPLQIDPEVWQELAAWLGRAAFYLDEIEWPPDFDNFEIGVDGEAPESHPDLAWAHHSVRAGRAVGCIGLRRQGSFETVSQQGRVMVHWILDETSHRAFWRSAIDVLGDSIAVVQELAPHAFPDTYFHRGVLGSLNSLVGGYLPFRKKIRQIFSVVDDWGAWIFTAAPPRILPTDEANNADGFPSNQLVQKRFQARGLEAAPEKPNVYSDKTCREARQITVEQEVQVGREIRVERETLYCEWHFKLEPHQNRIHVHAPVKTSGGRPVVGIVCDHLPLPGDH